MQELENVLREIESVGNIQFSSYTKPLIAVEDVIKIVRAHLSLENAAEIKRSSRDNDGWIPVEERLPEEKKSVLVQWEKYDRHLNVTLTYLDVMWLEDEEDVVFETINGIPNGRVIAWRPLPEPYYLESETEKPDWRQDMLRKFDRRE